MHASNVLSLALGFDRFYTPASGTKTKPAHTTPLFYNNPATPFTGSPAITEVVTVYDAVATTPPITAKATLPPITARATLPVQTPITVRATLPVQTSTSTSGAHRNGLFGQTVFDKLTAVKNGAKKLAGQVSSFRLPWYHYPAELQQVHGNRHLDMMGDGSQAKKTGTRTLPVSTPTAATTTTPATNDQKDLHKRADTEATEDVETTETTEDVETAEATEDVDATEDVETPEAPETPTNNSTEAGCDFEPAIFFNPTIREITHKLTGLERALARPPNPALVALHEAEKIHADAVLTVEAAIEEALQNSNSSFVPPFVPAGADNDSDRLARRADSDSGAGMSEALRRAGHNHYCHDRHRYKCRVEHLCPALADDAEYLLAAVVDHPEYGHQDAGPAAAPTTPATKGRHPLPDCRPGPDGYHCHHGQLHGHHKGEVCVHNCHVCQHNQHHHQEGRPQQKQRNYGVRPTPKSRTSTTTSISRYYGNPLKWKIPLEDEHGEEIYKPQPHKARDGSIELWSQRAYHGHKVVYGKFLNRCHTLSTYTHGHLGFGKSARIRKDGHMCLLFTGRGCSGYSTLVGESVPSLGPYDMDHRTKSVLCMDEEGAERYFAEEMWKSKDEPSTA